MPSVEEVKLYLATSIQQAEAATLGVRGVLERIDESLARLRETERDAMVLHYLRRMTFKEVGEALDLSEEAARKRVSRALEELRRFFVSRGVVFPAATIGLLLSSFAVQAAPVSLAPATAKLALMAASAQAGGFAASILELLIMTAKAKTAVIAVAGIVALITMVLQKQQNARLRAELAVVREENNRLSSAKQSRGLDRAAAQDLSASRSEARGKGTTADRKPSLDEIEAKVREAGSKAVWMPSSECRCARYLPRSSPIAAGLVGMLRCGLVLPDRPRPWS